MTMSATDEQQRPVDAGAVTVGRHRYLRAPVPVIFPEHEEVGEHKLHLELKTLLFEILKLAFADRAIIGCDQFVYWDPTSPGACLAPDAFVRLGGPDEIFSTWKVWERGAPHVAVEIISDHDRRDDSWDDKLERYRKLGVSELVRFDPTPRVPRIAMLRVWDRVEHDLVERALSVECAQSNVLPGFWLTREDPSLGPSLRLSKDERGEQLYLSGAEASRAEAEAAAQRIRELEAELARRQG
jgi:Uma2 family endonuclease